MNTWRLYVIQVRSGAVKIGITTGISLRRRAVCRKADLVREYLSPPVAGRLVESAALNRANGIAAARRGEWFFGLQFGEARNIVAQAARHQGRLCSTKRLRMLREAVSQ